MYWRDQTGLHLKKKIAGKTENSKTWQWLRDGNLKKETKHKIKS